MLPRVLFSGTLLAALCACQGPEVVRESPIQACFKNNTGRPILLWFWTGWNGYGGFEETWFELSPRDAVSVILKGPINVATATNKSAKIDLKRNLPPPGSSRFYDAQKKFYYYRILPDHIEPVLPNKAKGRRLLVPYRIDKA